MVPDNLEDIKQSVSTTPLIRGGANFETHILTKTNTGYKFKPSAFYAVFCGLFASVAYGALSYAVYQFIKTGNLLFLVENPIPAIVLSVFFIAGNILLIVFFSPIVFDVITNRFYKGFNIALFKRKKKIIHFNTIIALQIIGEQVSSDNGNYNSFELNLVLKDASRINVIDHGKLKTLIIDAKTLSEFLNIPIWHAESKK